MDSNTYAEAMVYALRNARSESFTQRGLHVTVGQIKATFQTEIGFGLDVPLISLVWSKSNTLPEWIARVLQFCNGGREDAALKEISLATTRFKANGEFAELSKNLERFDLRKFPDIVLVSLLRNTYSIRSHIPFWNLLLDQIEQILQEHKRESRFLLRGLKSYS